MMDQLYVLPILLFSVVIHELSHGWMALRLGDTTARDMGRLTLNPIPHIDPIGSIVVPLFSLMMAGRVFIAWAKPVPVNPLNFSNYRRDDILVSVVGPISNFLLSFACTIMVILLAHAMPLFQSLNLSLLDEAMGFLLKMFYAGIVLNVVLAVFNMIPVPPLDGSHVVASLMPEEMSHQYRSIGFFGIFIILLLMRWQPFAMIFQTVIGALTYPFELLIHFFV
jgi:Zn-dependent protease